MIATAINESRMSVLGGMPLSFFVTTIGRKEAETVRTKLPAPV
jgi:hypothetical protein